MAPNVINFSDIVEANGKTIRENNLEIQHEFPIGTLVEAEWTDGSEEDATWVRHSGRFWFRFPSAS